MSASGKQSLNQHTGWANPAQTGATNKSPPSSATHVILCYLTFPSTGTVAQNRNYTRLKTQPINPRAEEKILILKMNGHHHVSLHSDPRLAQTILSPSACYLSVCSPGRVVLFSSSISPPYKSLLHKVPTGVGSLNEQMPYTEFHHNSHSRMV